MSSEAILIAFLGSVIICLVRAHQRGRSLLGWGLFTFFLWPVALIATWFVGPKKSVGNMVPIPSPRPTPIRPPQMVGKVAIPTPIPPKIMTTPVTAALTSDATVIDVTGQEMPLHYQVSTSAPEPVQLTASAGSYVPPHSGYDVPQLGTQYRYKLGLKKQQVDWLNKLWAPQNVFIAIKGCCVATIQLYLQVMPALERELSRDGSSLAQLVGQSQQESSRLRRAVPNPYGWSEFDDRYLREQTQITIYATIFRRCENLVREVYGNKRKLAPEFSGLDETVVLNLETQLGRPLEVLLRSLVGTIQPPDEATELELNLQNVARWKQQFEGLALRLSATSISEFVEGVTQLGQRNARNPALEHIFFEASRIVAKYDREEALRFFLQYVYHDLRSVTVNNKVLAKTIQKSLFPQPEHLQRFEALVSQLVSDKNLPQALSQVPTVYARQRRKIELDLGAIREVQHQHAGTVELLSEYLQDEPEPVAPSIPAAAQESAPVIASAKMPEENIQLAVPTSAPVALTSSSPATSGWGLTTIQETLLTRFAEQGLMLPQAEVEAFARKHGALRNQLIDSINEQCYERLDDVLIEEEGDTYTIYESYYQQLATPC